MILSPKEDSVDEDGEVSQPLAMARNKTAKPKDINLRIIVLPAIFINIYYIK
jgi:hypothetical protein